MKHAHLIGIGGSGLSAIARVLVEDGYRVTGSDLELSSYAQDLENLGVKIYIGHEADQITGADFVLKSSAVPAENIEVLAAQASGIPVYNRAEFLGKLTENHYCIAVAGTHGKTTTTAMISWMLNALGHDPSYIIGGVSINLGTNAHSGESVNFVLEADEYERTFLGLHPQIAVVTNIEHDHPDSFPSENDFYSAFVDFVNLISNQGYLVACTDDEKSAKLFRYADQELDLNTLSYGLNTYEPGAYPDIQGANLSRNDRGSYTFDVFSGEESLAKVALKVPGLHNVRNSLASMGVAAIMEYPLEEAASALGDFQGTERRFEVRGEVSGITVIDDYAHHPTEIRSTLDAARFRYPDRNLWVVWQPHTYSRTETLFEQYLSAFEQADHVLVTEIFPSREKIRDDFSSSEIVKAIDHKDVNFIPSNMQVVKHLLSRLSSGDVVIILSAGDANQISKAVVDNLSLNGNGG